ncbi:MAG: 1,4-dihydroxy-2-naphthoate octaprenyltransferase [Cohaesibacter sp.]|jgi:1,4-dihydroxy-2-naphthoate octaprenyltransferase|nr:1,4-dihydroxy-2-naphthoate octaprenyltransferase [Cohaesibacter sp.]
MAETRPSHSSKTGIWLQAIRPKTLLLSLGPILAAGIEVWRLSGVDAADGIDPRWILLPLIASCAMAIQIATNLWNDAADSASGLDQASKRLGPPRMTSLGLLTAREVRMGAFVFLGYAALSGLILSYLGGFPIVMIGLLGLFCALGYSSGPYPISASPFGEIFVLVFFGILAVTGTTFLLTGHWPPSATLVGFYVGLPAAAVLTVNNHRDRVGDAKGGRRTLAILMGPDRTKGFYATLMLISSLGMMHVAAFDPVGILLSAALAGFAVLEPIRQVWLAEDAAALNSALAQTAAFQLIWVLAFGLLGLFQS